MEVKTTPFYRKKRAWLFVAIVLPFVLIFIVTRSFVMSPIVSSILQSRLGLQVEVGAAHWDWSGGIELNDVVIKAQGVKGPASDVVTLTSAIVVFAKAVPLFDQNIVSIDIEKIIVRLAESSENPGDFNVSHLFAKKTISTGGHAPTEVVQTSPAYPDIELHALTVETGLMLGSSWEFDHSMDFSVELLLEDKQDMVFQLKSMSDDLQFEVAISPSDSSINMKIDDVNLNQSIFDLMPRTVRAWCAETKLRGDVQAFQASWNPTDGINLEASVEDITFLLPIEHGFPWAHYQNGTVDPKSVSTYLDVRQGTIVYNGRSVELRNIQGSLQPSHQEHDTPVEFRSDISITGFPSMGDLESGDWMASMLSMAPFSAKFFIEKFQSPDQGDGTIDLPLAVARVLAIFQLKEWKVDAQVRVERVEVGGEIDVWGDLQIEAVAGMYEGFSYPLKNVESLIKFHQEEYQVVYLHAKGSEDAAVHISGDVKIADDAVVVELNLHVDDAPLDKALHDAVSQPIAEVMDRLLNVDAFEKMENVLTDSHGQRFELGGTIDIDFDLFHDSRVADGVAISGKVDFAEIGILADIFPFPVTLLDGSLLLDADGIHIPEDEYIRFKGLGGGFGKLTGGILFLTRGGAVPVFALELENELVTPALIEAISVSAKDSYEVALEVLEGLGIESRLDVKGKVMGRIEGDTKTDFTVNIKNGVATLGQQLASAVHAAGPFWPEGFQFTDVDAEITIVNGVVTMNGATCVCKTKFGHSISAFSFNPLQWKTSLCGIAQMSILQESIGSLAITMFIDGGDFELELKGVNVPISSRFVDVLPSSTSNKVATAWKMLHPIGVMDGNIIMKQNDDESLLKMEITPTLITVWGDEKSVDLLLQKGSVVVNNANVSLRELVFQLQSQNELQGELHIRGELNGNKDEFQFAIDAAWENAAIGSPLTRAIAGMANGKKGIENFDSIHPSGFASAVLNASGTEDSVFYNIEITPSKMSANIGDRRANLEFDTTKEAGNKIRIDNDGIIFDQLSGSLGEGTFIINTSEESIEVIDLEWHGPSKDESLFAVLPSVVGDTLEAIDITGGTSDLPDGKITLLGEHWSDLAIQFTGNISLTGISLDVGIPLKNIDGKTSVNGRYSKEHLSELELVLDIEQMSTLGRSVTNVDGSLVLDTIIERMYFKDTRGESTTGSVTVEGWIAVDGTKMYELEVFVAGVDLATEEEGDALASLEGELTGWLSIAGIRGDVSSRRGVGKIRVYDGHFAVNPLSLTAMQVLQLALPSAASIEGAEIELYIDGDRMVLEKITFNSNDSNIADLTLEGNPI